MNYSLLYIHTKEALSFIHHYKQWWMFSAYYLYISMYIYVCMSVLIPRSYQIPFFASNSSYKSEYIINYEFN